MRNYSNANRRTNQIEGVRVDDVGVRKFGFVILMMLANDNRILTINCGSSSLKIALFVMGKKETLALSAHIEQIGASTGHFQIKDGEGRIVADLQHHDAALEKFLNWLEERKIHLDAAGHRVVQGGLHYGPAELITPQMETALAKLEPLDPDHLPLELKAVKTLRRLYPDLPQVACFDTAFHRTMPRVAKLLPIPRRYDAKRVQRYGFHGLSYTYLMEELTRLGDPAALKGRVVLAHLGNGASLAAVRDGKSIDTSMGFTPTAGLVMGTRSGDLDPGLLSFLARSERMTGAQIDRLVNHESGLLGVSETSSDMRDLLAQEAGDLRAAEAVTLFCYQARKWIGSFAAALGGLDTLVFAGGIGENAPLVRTRICEGMRFLGIELDDTRNAESAGVISAESGRVAVRVIRTNEELMIARSVWRILGHGAVSEDD